MKVSIAQIRVIPGQANTNFLNIKKHVEMAKKNGADLVVFPEMCVGGYFVGDRYLDDDFRRFIASFNQRIINLSDNIGIIWGNIHIDPIDEVIKGRDGRNVRFNAAFFAYNKTLVKRENGKHPGIYIKHLNPDYRMFDDSRYFLSGLELMSANKTLHSQMLAPFVFNRNGVDHRISLQVCEDLWDDDYAYKVTQEVMKYKPDLLVNISSSPWTLNKEVARKRHLAKKAKVPTIYVNATGLQDVGKNVLLFDGGSLICVGENSPIIELNDRFEEQHFFVDLSKPIVEKPLIKTSKLFDAIVASIRLFDEQMFKQKVKWIIGLSGGIDSALNTALLTIALGKNRVLAFNLPSHFNSKITIDNAQHLAQKLGVSYTSYSIEKLILETKQLFSEVSGPVEENIHARLRGHVLSTLAQIHGGVVCNNGNKVEVALGYCTLYGDTIGALSPLGDLTKIQVNELANEVNTYFDDEIIPKNLIAKIIDGIPHYEVPPTAELKHQQVDPMKWGYHDWLLNKIMTFPTRGLTSFIDEYLNNRLDENITRLIKHYGLEKKEVFFADLKWFLSYLDGSVFKRIQMPPIVTISRGAFGFDYRETQAKIEQYLKELI